MHAGVVGGVHDVALDAQVLRQEFGGGGPVGNDAADIGCGEHERVGPGLDEVGEHCFATDTPAGQLAFLDARHRAHARVEDRIRTAKDTGLNHFPSRSFAINAAWLSVVMLAVDWLSWTQRLVLDGALAKAEPKTLRYRLLHVAARITRGQRRTWTRIQQTWPWAADIANAFARLHALPVPAG